MSNFIDKASAAVERYKETITEDSSPVIVYRAVDIIIEDRRPDTLDYKGKYKVMLGEHYWMPFNFDNKNKVIEFIRSGIVE